MKGNFKVRCIKSRDVGVTVGKIYEFVDGFSHWNNGEVLPQRTKHEISRFKNIDDLRTWFGGEFSTELFELVLDNKEITIRQKGRKVIAVMTEGGKYVKSANAKCSPTDEFDFNIGAKLAFSRLMGEEKIDKPYVEVKQNKYEVGDKVKLVSTRPVCWASGGGMDKYLDREVEITEINGNFFKFDGSGDWCFNFCDIEKKISVIECQPSTTVREVKRPAKVGEWIKVVNADTWFNEYKNGDMFKVDDLYSSREEGIISKPHHIVPREYVVLENYQPEATKTLADFTDKELITELAKRWEDKQ